MECACVNVDVDDYADLISDTTPTARKVFKCHECKEGITPGQQYRREVTVYDGRLETNRTCLDCISIRNAFFCGGWYWGDILDSLKEAIWDSDGQISESCIASLTPGARERVCRMIDECKQ